MLMERVRLNDSEMDLSLRKYIGLINCCATILTYGTYNIENDLCFLFLSQIQQIRCAQVKLATENKRPNFDSRFIFWLFAINLSERFERVERSNT